MVLIFAPLTWLLAVTNLLGHAEKVTEQFGEVEVEQAQSVFTADGVQYPKGSYVIRTAQPFGAFAKTMMEKQVYPDLREYPGGPPQRPYDVTAHTLPMQMGVKVITVTQPFQANLTKAETITDPAGIVETGPAKAYLLEHESKAFVRGSLPYS